MSNLVLLICKTNITTNVRGVSAYVCIKNNFKPIGDFILNAGSQKMDFSIKCTVNELNSAFISTV